MLSYGSKMPKVIGQGSFYTNGYIFLFGGMYKDKDKISISNDLYMFDPDICLEWATEPQLGTPPPVCAQHIMLHITHIEKILVHGGSNLTEMAIDDIFLFDYKRWAWEKIPCKNIIRLAAHDAVYVEELQKVYIYGGGDGKDTFLNIYCLNFDTYPGSLHISIVNTEGTPVPKIGPKCFYYYPTSTFFTFGGFAPKLGYVNELACVNLSIKKPNWEILKPDSVDGKFPKARAGCSLVVKDCIAYIYGGINNGKLMNDFWIFDMVLIRWNKVKSLSDLPFTYGHTMNFLTDKVVLIFGGSQIFKEICDMGSNASYTLKLKTDKRKVDEENKELNLLAKSKKVKYFKDNFSAAHGFSIENEVYFVLAKNSGKTYLNGSIPPRIFHRTVNAGNSIYVFGGANDPNMYEINMEEIMEINMNENDKKLNEIVDVKDIINEDLEELVEEKAEKTDAQSRRKGKVIEPIKDTSKEAERKKQKEEKNEIFNFMDKINGVVKKITKKEESEENEDLENLEDEKESPIKMSMNDVSSLFQPRKKKK